jgi:hypothetical protein
MDTPVINRTSANELWYEFFSKKGKGWLPVLTGSMVPLIRPGDRVFIIFTGAENIKFGDILLFKRDGEFIVHRVLRTWRTPRVRYFLEEGDARHQLGLVSAGKIIGRVTLVKRSNRIFDLTSPLSRLTSAALTLWLYLATGTVAPMKHSKNAAVRKAGWVFSRLLLVLSNLGVRACLPAWYLPGLFQRDLSSRADEPGQLRNAPSPMTGEAKN